MTRGHHPITRRDGRHGLHPGLWAPVLGGLLAAAGCEINKPEMPSFDTSLTLPLGVERLDVLEAVDSEEHLVVGGDGGLYFHVVGDPDSLALDFDLAVDIPSQDYRHELGRFSLPAPAPVAYSFPLQDTLAAGAALQGQTLVVPPFPIDLLSDDEDLPDVVSAVLAAGAVTMAVSNGLPVPVSADSGPDQLVLALENPADGAAVATFPFPYLPPGADAELSVDLAGAVLPDRLRVRLQGGSPGSGGQPVTLDAAAAISVSAVFSDLVVESAAAVVEAQSYQSTFTSDFPADYAIASAVVAAGAVTLDVRNDLPLPCTAVLTWPEVRDAAGGPLYTYLALAPGQSDARTVDFAGCTVSGGGLPLSALTAQVSVSVDGSNGQPVTLAATDALAVSVAGGAVSFASVTGAVPRFDFALDPVATSIDMPAELSGLSLTAASLTLRVAMSAAIPADLDLTLTGVSAAGQVATLDVSETLPVSYDQAYANIRLDQDNSNIVAFLNNLPEEVTLAGAVGLGGDGAVGTVRPGDRAVLSWEIDAPVTVIIDEASLTGEPQVLDLDEDLRRRIDTHALGAVVETEVTNHLPVGLQLMLRAAADSAALDAAPLLTIGPLHIAPALVSPTTGTVQESVISRPTFSLDQAQARVFGTPGLIIRFEAVLPSTAGQAVRVLSSDYVEVRGVVRMDVLVDDQL